MKITKAIHHGQTRYRVNDPTGERGRRLGDWRGVCGYGGAMVRPLRIERTGGW
ncbi:MAG: hypothetical protein MUE94_12690 [Verrucomicrobia bacterium]|nr:hypothetical protein [Verrucomicrobiota bacterium]